MSAPLRHQNLTLDEATIQREGRRILRRLAEPGSVLAIGRKVFRGNTADFSQPADLRTGVSPRGSEEMDRLRHHGYSHDQHSAFAVANSKVGVEP